MNTNTLVIIIYSIISLICHIKLDVNKIFILNCVFVLVSPLGIFKKWGERERRWVKTLKSKTKRLLTYNCSFEFCSGRFTRLGCVSLLLWGWNELKKQKGPQQASKCPLTDPVIENKVITASLLPNSKNPE